MLQNIKIFFADLSTIWENTVRCAEKYRCETALYLLSMLEHAYNTIIDSGVEATGHGIDVTYGSNATDKWFISMLTTKVQLPGAEAN